MTTRTADTLGGVQKTLLLPLWGRAVETGRSATNIHPITRLAWIARATHVDRTVVAFLARRPRATIVNLGCGLDTTFERVDNGQLTWIDLDLPDVIELREGLVGPSPRRRAFACSVLDPRWLDELEVDEGVMLVAAGVLYYLEEHDVRALLARLATALPGAELVADVCSPRGARIANKRVIEDSGMDPSASLRRGIERPQDLASWARRIVVLETYRLFRGFGTGLPWKARLGMWLSDALAIMSMVHLRFVPALPEADT